VEFEVETNPSNGKLTVVNVTGVNGAPLKPVHRPLGKGRGKGKTSAVWNWSPAKADFTPSRKGKGKDADKGRGKAIARNTVFVAALAQATTSDSLKDHFEEVGEVVDAFVVMDGETGRSRGFGKVIFAERDQMERAIKELNGALLDGRNIVVREDHGPLHRRDVEAWGDKNGVEIRERGIEAGESIKGCTEYKSEFDNSPWTGVEVK